MCFHLFTNKLQPISSILFVPPRTKVPYKTVLKTTKLDVFSFIYIIYIKSHKLNAHERPHEQSSRIKPPSILPTFLITGAVKRTA